MKVLGLVVILSVFVVFVLPSPIFGLGPLGVPDLSKIEYPGGEPPSDELVQLGKVLFLIQDYRLTISSPVPHAIIRILGLETAWRVDWERWEITWDAMFLIYTIWLGIQTSFSGTVDPHPWKSKRSGLFKPGAK